MKKCKITKNTSVIVLLSGGIDSTACVQYYLKNGFSTSAIFIDYEQLPVKMEESSAKKICSYYNINLNTIRVNGPEYCKKVEIKGRNAIFVLLALMFYPKHVGIISLGIHSGTPYYDCTENFSNDIKNILNGYSNGKIRFDAPFLKWNKKMIYDYCKLQKIPVELTYSCEIGINGPCGECPSCKDRSNFNVS